MMRTIRAGVGLLAAIGLLWSPATARAGGAVFLFEDRAYRPGETVVARVPDVWFESGPE